MDPSPRSAVDGKAGRFVALVLRHAPKEIGIQPDRAGWVKAADLIRAMRAKGFDANRRSLEQLVAEDDKGRYVFSADGLRIRAQQGHSIPVDLGLEEATPPALLYHGTKSHLLDDVFRDGLLPMSRHHVHLSADPATARDVGMRRGRAVLLRVDAAAMVADGLPFWRSGNGVWLADAVPPGYFRILAQGETS